MSPLPQLTPEEEATAFLVRFSEAVRGLADARVVADTACRLLVQQLRADRAHWAEIDWGTQEYVIGSRFVVDGVSDGTAGRYPLDAWPSSTSTLMAGHSMVVEDPSLDARLPASARDAQAKIAVAAFVAVPVLVHGKLRAVLTVNQRAPRRWTPQDVALVEGVATRCWAEVELARTEGALRESEQRMRLAIRATRMVTWEWLPADDRITTSDNFPDLYGLPALAGARDGFGLVLLEDREPHLAKVRKIAAEGGTYDSEFRIRRPVDGKIVWLEERAEAQLGAQGEVERIIGITLDITERKRTEAALRESEELNTFLLRLSDVLRPLTDPVSVQHEAARLVGEYLGCAWSYYGATDFPFTQMTVERCYSRGAVPSLVGVHPVASATIRAMLQAGQPVSVRDVKTDPVMVESAQARLRDLGMRSFAAAPMAKDGVLRAVLVVADTHERGWTERELRLITEVVERTWSWVERAHAEAVLRASETSLKLADRTKDEFLAVLGHELRTPLAAIMLWAGVLRSGKTSEEEKTRAIDAILESATAQSRVVNDLLDLSRLMTGKLLLSPEEVVVEDVVRASVEVLRPSARAKRLELSLEVAPSLGRAVLDPSRLRQVLLNLLSNAIQFTPEGGSVTLKVWHEAEFLEAEVADTGEGIAPEFFPYLFERFRQADMAETRRHGGLGIGLALSRQLVELQGGTISGRSEGVGKGATFRVRLPWVAVGGARLDKSPGVSTPGHGEAPLLGTRVLIVEDDENTLAAMESTLRQAGARIVGVRSASAALEAFQALDVPGSTTVLVSDLGLSGMSGYELVQRITEARRARGRPPIAACAVSAHAADADRRRAIEAGFDLFVAKPVSSEQLVEAVVDLVQLGIGAT